MRGKILVLVAIAALVIGVAPRTSLADVITSVVVNVGSSQWCNTTATAAQGCNAASPNRIWNLGPSGVTLNPSDRLFLSQTGGTFNFDTSEVNSRVNPTIIVNGAAPLADTTGVLNPIDPVTNQFNEARNYVPIGTGSSFEILIGYFDNIHTNACADTSGTIAGNCQPDPFTAVAGLAAPAINNVFTDPSAFPNHCAPGGTVATCWDAGVIEIHGLSHVPEPATLLLLGVGLIGLAAYGTRHLKKNV